MKKILIILSCALGALIVVPSADAGYRRTIVGYDSKGKPIIQVVWVADHLDYPRTVFDRRTYPTSGRRDLTPLYRTPAPAPSYPAYPYPAYSISPYVYER